MVIKYKEFNGNTVFDGYHIPSKTVPFNRIQWASWFLKIDCKSKYCQTKIDEESIPLTAFSSPQGHYNWMVMSFGVKNVPHILQRRMGNIFNDLNQYCLVYIDDIFVFFKTIEQHKDDILAITQKCISHGIVLDKNKCIYAEQEIQFLYLEIKAGQIILQKFIL